MHTCASAVANCVRTLQNVWYYEREIRRRTENWVTGYAPGAASTEKGADVAYVCRPDVVDNGDVHITQVVWDSVSQTAQSGRYSNAYAL